MLINNDNDNDNDNGNDSVSLTREQKSVTLFSAIGG